MPMLRAYGEREITYEYGSRRRIFSTSMCGLRGEEGRYMPRATTIYFSYNYCVDYLKGTHRNK